MIIVVNGQYRLCSIERLKNINIAASSFDCEEQPIQSGLAIEKKCKEGNSWYVIAFIHYNDKEPCCEIESVGERILDIDDDEWATVRRMIKAGCELVACANQ